MKRVLKFCFRTHFVQVSGLIFLIAAVSLILNLLSPARPIGDGLYTGGKFASFYSGFPLMCVLLQSILSIQCAGVNMNVAITMGARRRDYAVVIHIFLIIETVISLLLIHGLYLLNEKLFILSRFYTYFYSPENMPMLAMLIIAAQTTGMGCMTIGSDKRVLGSMLMAVLTMALMTAFMFSMGVLTIELWGDLPAIIFGALALASLAGEIGYWRYALKATVK